MAAVFACTSFTMRSFSLICNVFACFFSSANSVAFWSAFAAYLAHLQTYFLLTYLLTYLLTNLLTYLLTYLLYLFTCIFTCFLYLLTRRHMLVHDALHRSQGAQDGRGRLGVRREGVPVLLDGTEGGAHGRAPRGFSIETTRKEGKAMEFAACGRGTPEVPGLEP